jgi:hypothetical protein
MVEVTTSYLRYHGEVLNERGHDVSQIEALSGGQLGQPSIEVSFRLSAIGSVQVRLTCAEAGELMRHIRQALESVQND